MPSGYCTRLKNAANACFGRFECLSNFETAKAITIKDWRLGLVLRLLQVGILIYILYHIIEEASYLTQEVPKGMARLAPNVTEVRLHILIDQEKKYDDDEHPLPYCKSGGRDYEYKFSGKTYNDFQCVMVDPFAIPESGETEFFLTTYLRLDKVFYVNSPRNESGCPDPNDIDTVPDNAEKLGLFYGICVYNLIEQYFPIGPEEIPMELVHSYYTSTVNAKGELPETIITAPDYNGPEIHVKKGSAIGLTMRDLLNVAGVDLDKPLGHQANNNGISETVRDRSNIPFPYARLSGVTLILSFKYYHRALAPAKYRVSLGPRSGDVICIIEVEPQYTWTTKTLDVHFQISNANHPFILNPGRKVRSRDNVHYEAVQVDFKRHGVRVVYQVAGNMGKFEVFSLMNAIIAGAVLLGIAQSIVTLIALHALGLSSTLYGENMSETIDWRTQYARFSAQALVAGNTFESFDKNGSGTLDRREIYQHLLRTFRDILDPPKLACLADFLMRHIEMDSDVAKGRLEDVSDIRINTINMAEWIDIFTEDEVKISSLNRLVEGEYNNPKLIGILLGLAEGRTGHDLLALMSGEGMQSTSQDLKDPLI